MLELTAQAAAERGLPAAELVQGLLAAGLEPAAVGSGLEPLAVGWFPVAGRRTHPVAGRYRSGQAEPSRLARRPTLVPVGHFQQPGSARSCLLRQGCPSPRKLPKWTA